MHEPCVQAVYASYTSSIYKFCIPAEREREREREREERERPMLGGGCGGGGGGGGGDSTDDEAMNEVRRANGGG